MSQLALLNDRTGDVVVSNLNVADNFFARFVGLQFRPRLAHGTGLLLVPCPSIHTFCMRFAIDAVFLSREGRVVQVTSGVQPWRFVVCREKAHAVLEVASNDSSVTFKVGDHLRVAGDGARCLPKSLQFLAGG